ncbi:hypothetical protein [Deinococcus multiflagellatus]|uniref:Uncharacterized protein n=1 Tax=Deinococcus multiflagellatus TaxID=1656887 RepID=A0ABW1ZR07_9DEIO|nr:hypothetical protein [Deinococcus multiflagellatus]MBZ9715331.1 hypothetical protein [Deinococcus multiflagellatus]
MKPALHVAQVRKVLESAPQRAFTAEDISIRLGRRLNKRQCARAAVALSAEGVVECRKSTKVNVHRRTLEFQWRAPVALATPAHL